MMAHEVDAVVHTANNQKQALAVGFTLGYIRAHAIEPDMELFTRVAASTPELATEPGRETLSKVIDDWRQSHSMDVDENGSGE